MLKKTALVIILLACIAGAVGFYLYFKPSGNFKDAKPEITVNADSLIHDFTVDEAAANAKYLNKIIQVQGVVNDITVDEKGLTNINLAVENEMAMVTCAMDSTAENDYKAITRGSAVKIKGQCSGMLMDIVMIKCVLLK